MITKKLVILDANFKYNNISDQYDRQESSPNNTKNLVHVNVGCEARLLEIIDHSESKVKGKEKPTKAVTPSVKVVFRTKSRTWTIMLHSLALSFFQIRFVDHIL